MVIRKISILGCGWLGKQLAKSLLSDGYTVKGSVTSIDKVSELKKFGIQPYFIQVLNHEIRGDKLPEFFDSDVLIISFPPPRVGKSELNYLNQIRLINNSLIKIDLKKVILISSTAVYPDINAEVFENQDYNPTTPRSQQLLEAESILMNNGTYETTTIRFGGLVGPNRNPGKFLAGKTNVENGQGLVNLIHLDDCINLITQIIEQNCWGEIFNACAEVHPTREDFYTKAAIKLNLEPPQFSVAGVHKFKKINSEKIKDKLNYTFKYSNPFDMF